MHILHDSAKILTQMILSYFTGDLTSGMTQIYFHSAATQNDKATKRKFNYAGNFIYKTEIYKVIQGSCIRFRRLEEK